MASPPTSKKHAVKRTYTVHQAKTNLSKLIAQACKGEEVVIARGKEPVARLVPITSELPKRVPGTLKGLVTWEKDAFAPLTPAELKDWGIE